MSQQPVSAPVDEPRKAPIPEFLYKIVNPTIGAILRSPLHGIMSGALMLITFTVRRTGRRITTPVSYQRRGDTLRVLVHRPWWKNLRDGAVVTVRLQGRDRAGRASATQERAVLLSWLRERLAEVGGVKNARRLAMSELDPTREPTDDELLHAARGAALVEIELDPA